MTQVRHPAAVFMAAATTFLLLFVMQLLIRMTPPLDRGEKSFRLVPFVKVETDPETRTRREPPAKPPKPDRAPETELSPADVETPIAPIRADWSLPRLPGPAGAAGFPDGDIIALRQIAPAYPERARQRGIEGYVIVEFTVTSAGTTHDIVVVESSHSLLEDAAVKAARKARYRPRIVDGRAIPVHGMRNRFTFALEN